MVPTIRLAQRRQKLVSGQSHTTREDHDLGVKNAAEIDAPDAEVPCRFVDEMLSSCVALSGVLKYGSAVQLFPREVPQACMCFWLLCSHSAARFPTARADA